MPLGEKADAELRVGSGCASDGGGVRNDGRCVTDAALLARWRAARRSVGKAVGVFAHHTRSRRPQPQLRAAASAQAVAGSQLCTRRVQEVF